jgi:hypothetical protein
MDDGQRQDSIRILAQAMAEAGVSPEDAEKAAPDLIRLASGQGDAREVTGEQSDPG